MLPVTVIDNLINLEFNSHITEDNFDDYIEYVTKDNLDSIITEIIGEIEKYPYDRYWSYIPIAYDTETTKVCVQPEIKKSVINRAGKLVEKIIQKPIYYSFVYISQWTFGQKHYFVRDWSTNIALIKNLILRLTRSVRIAVANLSYEMNFIRKDLAKFEDIDNSSCCDGNHSFVNYTLNASHKMQFVDICRISNMSLYKIAKSYCYHKKYKPEDEAKQFSYDIIRNSKTPLTKIERWYCISDTLTASEYIAYIYNKFSLKGLKFPNTSTGIIRNQMHVESCKPEYADIVRNAKLSYPATYEEYSNLVQFLFRGGYTHSNAIYVGQIINNVVGCDYTSSYPAVMVHEKYPTIFKPKVDNYIAFNYNGTYKYGSEPVLNFDSENYAFYAYFEFYDLKATTTHSIESIHKLIEKDLDNYPDDNGRIHKAKYIKVMITEQDYDIYRKYYTWSKCTISNIKFSKKDWLPGYVIKPLLLAYFKKSQLKIDRKTHDPEYPASKTIVCSAYGCCVQRLNIADYFKLDDNGEFIKLPFDISSIIPKIGSKPDISDPKYKKKRDDKYGKKGELTKKYYDDLEKYNNSVAYKKKAMDELYVSVSKVWSRTEFEEYVDCMLNNKPISKDNEELLINKARQLQYKKTIRCISKDSEFKTDKNNNNIVEGKFLSLYWGIWITAYARHNILSHIYDVEQNAIKLNRPCACLQSDTDSMYIRDIEYHWPIVAEWNQKWLKWNTEKFSELIDRYNLCDENGKKFNDPKLLSDLGCFEIDPSAIAFKGLGSKRYAKIYESDGHLTLKLTVAGLSQTDYEKYEAKLDAENRPDRELYNKALSELSSIDCTTTEYENTNLKQKLGELPTKNYRGTYPEITINKYIDQIKTIMKDFNTGLFIDSNLSSKLVPIYTDDYYEYEYEDYQGNKCKMFQNSGISLVSSCFSMKIADGFKRHLEIIKRKD